MALTAAEVFRDYTSDGIPPSGPYTPEKSKIRTLLGQYEQIISSFLQTGGRIYSSLATIAADLNHPANTMAWVVGDAIAGNNGVYLKLGIVGSGSWVRVADLPYSFIAAEDSGEGTANAIKATSSIPVSPSALILVTVYEPNTGSPVTISFNGGDPLTIKTNSGNDVIAGGLVGGMVLAGRISGTTFRLLSDQAGAAILAAAEAILEQMGDNLEAATAALVVEVEGIRDEAQAAATEAQAYAEMVGAAVYDFNFDSDPETPGYDWND